ncbi:MAG: hypothetical protein JW708_03050, partial [Vallitaleaceae bacterium]|nr:hypothetical protein [Vallitaleaceae bacterium]
MKKLTALGMVLFLLLSAATSSLAVEKTEEEYLEEIAQLYQLIDENYSGSEVTRKELFEAAMKGMTGILDDYSV